MIRKKKNKKIITRIRNAGTALIDHIVLPQDLAILNLEV